MIWRIWPLSCIAIVFICKLYRSYSETFLFDPIVFWLMGVIGLFIGMMVAIKDFKQYKLEGNKMEFLPTSVGCFFLIIIGCLYFFISYRINAPTLISAYRVDGIDGFCIDLKENGRFVIANGGGIGLNYTHGRYTLNDSIVNLDRTDMENGLKTTTLKICKTTEQGYSPYDEFIVQIDQYGNEVGDYNYRVTEDNRK